MTATMSESKDLSLALAQAVGADLYPDSIAAADGALFCLLRRGETKLLGVFAPDDHPLLDTFQGERTRLEQHGLAGVLAPRDAPNAAALRTALPWLRPRPLALATSVGFGDRLGLATPAHARAVARSFTRGEDSTAGSGLMPVFAQQSIRENERTGRTPQEVLDDAMWGVFEAGWRRGYGADADHLKTTADVDLTVAAGYTMFTVDPGDFVEPVESLDRQALQARFEALPWEDLEDRPADLRARFLTGDDPTGLGLRFDEVSLAVAAVKYGRAVAHTAMMYRRLVERRGAENFELEVSVDETTSPTSHLEHLYIASELRRLGVRWVGLAPRFVGRFEKGVDYQGEAGGLAPDDLERFAADFAGHAAIARTLGPYKLSLHSGSDKFSIYPIAAEAARGLIHLKTAGTSYLEALRAVARLAPNLFRQIYDFAMERYPEDRASYHISAQLERMPAVAQVTDADLPALLDHFDARQVLHVTFGSVLNARTSEGAYRFKDDLYAILRAHEAEHYAAIEAHFERHLAPFLRV